MPSDRKSEVDIEINPLLLGIWFALLGGLGDLFLYLVSSVLMHRYTHLSPQLIWISPASNLVLYSLPAFMLWALARWRPRRYWRFATAFLFAFLTTWGLLIYATRVHTLAALVLAVGIAFQTARLINAHPGGTRHLIRYTLPALAAFVILGGLGLNAWERIKERREVAALPAAVDGAPNVLLVILDTVRAMNLGLYGYPRATSPALEQFAKRGVVFDFAMSAASWTLPSHATMFTGHWPHELSANWRVPLDARYPTLAEVLASHGYRTAGFVANDIYATRESGLARGFQHYDDLRFSFATIALGSALGRSLNDRPPVLELFHDYDYIGRKRAREVNAQALDWLDHLDQKQRPFFVFLNYFDAHDPYIAPPPFDTLFDKERLRFPPGMDLDTPLTRAGVVTYVDSYDESVAQLDYQIGLLLGELDRRGKLRNTVVIITSDHGEELGEHGLQRHGKSLYVQELHVPLLVSFDGRVPRGVRVGGAVSLRDLAATVLDLAGIADNGSGPGALPGHSLTRFWSADAARADSGEAVISEVRYHPTRPRREPASRGDMASIIEGTRHLIRSGDGVIEMYDLARDSVEERNLASQPELRNSINELAAKLRMVPVNLRR